MKTLRITTLALAFATLAFAVKDVVTATHGTVSKIDKAGKTIVVKSADGTEHVYHWAADTVVHGGKAAGVAGKDSWHGLKEGSEVVAHSTKRGTEDTRTTQLGPPQSYSSPVSVAIFSSHRFGDDARKRHNLPMRIPVTSPFRAMR